MTDAIFVGKTPPDDGYHWIEITAFSETEPRWIRGAVKVDAPDLLTTYFMRRRETLIIELRELDRLLGWPQTVPERKR